MANNIIDNALYVVATPIGNLDDITFRAIEVLKNVDVVAAEDTRNTSVLFSKYNISTKLISYHKFSEASRIDLFLDYLNSGKSVALVSDAGTPLISDPGNVLVQEIRKHNFKVIPVVGACAVIALLSSVYRKDEDFKFIGFLPKSDKNIVEIFNSNLNENLVFYESPNRLLDTLKLISVNFPDKRISIGRELTKKFEEIIDDTILNVIQYFKTNILKGELVCILHKSLINKEFNFDSEIKKLKSLNYKNKDISIILSSLYNANKNSIYKRSMELD